MCFLPTGPRGRRSAAFGLLRSRTGLCTTLDRCGTQTVHLGLSQLAVGTGLEHTQLHHALGVALQAHHLKTHTLAHPANLAVLALLQGHLHHGAARLIGDHIDGTGHGLGAVVQHDAAAQLEDGGLVGAGLHGNAVQLGDTAGRMGDGLCKGTVVGHQQQTLAVLIQTTHRVQAGGDVADQVHHGLAA